MVKLGVNIDHVATVRQARHAVEPDPVAAAVLAELAGADGITVHLREDRRHIQDRDVELLRKTVRTRLNLEMAASDEMVAIACRIRPDQVTLVPESREELTTEGGLEVAAAAAGLRERVARLQQAGIAVSLFVDPDPVQVAASREIGATAVELHTGSYANATGEAAIAAEHDRLMQAGEEACTLGLVLLAGHGLTYWNVGPVARIPGISELNIGHSLVSRAILVGMERAVSDMKRAMA